MKKQKTWETLEVGDEIEDSYGDPRRIFDFSMNKKIIFYDLYEGETITYNSIEGLIEEGYTIVQDKEEESINNFCPHRGLCTCSNPKETGNIEINTGIGRKQTTPSSLQDEEDVKKLIDRTKEFLVDWLEESYTSYHDANDLLAKWKEVEVDKINIIK